MSQAYRPLGDRVVIKREEKKKTPHGLILPHNSDGPQVGVVIATGKGRVTESGSTVPMSLNEGDRILFLLYAATEFSVDGETYHVMRESDALVVLGK